VATLRKWLDEVHFDWESGRILLQERDEHTHRWDAPTSARWLTKDDPVLDKKFDDGYGAVQCPPFIAEDRECIYFPGCYDGSTWLSCVYKDIAQYLDLGNETPCVGGG
jgi:hypothetical protein